MQLINRHLFYIVPKQPLVDWINLLDPVNPVTLEDCTGHDSADVYLIPEFDNDEMALEWLEKEWEIWFDVLLHNWWEDETDYPQKRSFEMLNDFFEITYQSMIIDMLDIPLIKEDQDEPEDEEEEN